MKIVSKYKDYYDAGLVYGIDEKLYFKRDQSQDEITRIFSGEIDTFKKGEIDYTLKMFPLLIGFCGSFYPLIQVSLEKIKGDRKTVEDDFIYKYEDLQLHLNKLGCNVVNIKKKNYSKVSSYQDGLFYGNQELDINIERLEAHLKNIVYEWGNTGEVSRYDEYHDIFTENNAAYFIIGVYKHSREEYRKGYYQDIWHNYIIIHPILKDYKFSQVKDAFIAFQEISMFLGNMNNPDDKMLELDDKYIAFSKGFCSHSFKKRPTKSKQKPCDRKNSLE